MTEVEIVQPICAKHSSQPQVGSKPKQAATQAAHPRRRMLTGGGQGRRHPRRQNPQFHYHLQQALVWNIFKQLNNYTLHKMKSKSHLPIC